MSAPVRNQTCNLQLYRLRTQLTNLTRAAKLYIKIKETFSGLGECNWQLLLESQGFWQETNPKSHAIMTEGETRSKMNSWLPPRSLTETAHTFCTCTRSRIEKN